MTAHGFHEVYLHLNWHVKDDRPTLAPMVETLVYEIITDRCKKMNGVYLHGIGGTPTHVHLAVNIEPSVAISQMVKDLKGGSSHDANARLNQKLLYWQRGYGVVSFGKNNLDWVLEYIANQKQHHARRSLHDRLERTTSWEPEV
jgi:putative transposase